METPEILLATAEGVEQKVAWDSGCVSNRRMKDEKVSWKEICFECDRAKDDVCPRCDVGESLEKNITKAKTWNRNRKMVLLAKESLQDGKTYVID